MEKPQLTWEGGPLSFLLVDEEGDTVFAQIVRDTRGEYDIFDMRGDRGARLVGRRPKLVDAKQHAERICG